MTTIIIPLYRGDLIESVLQSIAGQRNILIAETILVLNQSLVSQREHFLKLSKAFANVKVTNIEINNVSAARNKGLSLSISEYSLFMDEDCILSDPQCLEKMLMNLKTNDGIGAGTLFVLKQRPFKEKFYNFKINLWMQSHAQPLLAGGICLYRTESIKKLGFDPQIEYGGSETSLLNQIFKNQGGRLILVHEKMILHSVNEGWFDLFKKAKRQQFRGKSFTAIPKLQPTKMVQLFFAENDLNILEKIAIGTVLIFEKMWNLF